MASKDTPKPLSRTPPYTENIAILSFPIILLAPFWWANHAKAKLEGTSKGPPKTSSKFPQGPHNNEEYSHLPKMIYPILRATQPRKAPPFPPPRGPSKDTPKLPKDPPSTYNNTQQYVPCVFSVIRQTKTWPPYAPLWLLWGVLWGVLPGILLGDPPGGILQGDPPGHPPSILRGGSSGGSSGPPPKDGVDQVGGGGGERGEV